LCNGTSAVGPELNDVIDVKNFGNQGKADIQAAVAALRFRLCQSQPTRLRSAFGTLAPTECHLISAMKPL
jgi:hypothetical protein